MPAAKTSNRIVTKTMATPPPTKVPLTFHSKAKLWSKPGLRPDAMRCLSNFAPFSVEFQGTVYPSVENAFQAAKYTFTAKPELVVLLHTCGPKEAKRLGSRKGMKEQGVSLDVVQWDDNKDTIMAALIESKISRNPEIRAILEHLKQFDTFSFVHYSLRDMYWGAHVDELGRIKKGLNKLGKIYNDIVVDIDM
jgi:ribA/ribD-fused uncharacterized protein